MAKKIHSQAVDVIRPTVVYTKAEEVFNAGKRMFFLQGSSRSGKTYNFTIWYILKAYYSDKPLSVVVVRSTLPRLRRTALKDFQKIMRDMGIWGEGSYISQPPEYTFRNGSTVSFFATEDPAVAQGLYSDILFINEATEINYETWVQLTMRCTTFIAIDYNPNFSDDFWIKKEILYPGNKDRLVVFRTTYKDNPYLPAEQVAEIEKLRFTNDRLWRIYGLGEQALVEGLVYDHFEVMDEFPERFERRAGIGVDWGYTDPFAVVKVFVDVIQRRLYVQELCYKSRLSMEDQLAIMCDEDIRHRTIIADSSAPQFITACRKLGMRIRKTVKNSVTDKSSILPGISAVQSYTIVVCGNSPNIETELHNYVYKQDRDGNYMNEPIDSYNHCFTATTLITMADGFERPIIDVHEGDMVMTSKGPRPVVRKFHNGLQYVYDYIITYEDADGAMRNIHLSSTPMHKIQTDKGEKPICEIEPNDRITLRSTFLGMPISSIMDSDTIAGVIRNFTELYGSTTTGRFLLATMSITSMASLPITALKIWLWCLVQNIYTGTWRSGRKTRRSWTACAVRWIMRGTMRTFGINLPKEEHGTPSMVQRSLLISNLRLMYVSNVVRSFCQRNPMPNSAPMLASLPTEEILMSMTKRGFAQFVAKSLRSINTLKPTPARQVVVRNIVGCSVSKLNVYNMEVAETHDYYANGVLVLNCLDAIRYYVYSTITKRKRTASVHIS